MKVDVEGLFPPGNPAAVEYRRVVEVDLANPNTTLELVMQNITTTYTDHVQDIYEHCRFPSCLADDSQAMMLRGGSSRRRVYAESNAALEALSDVLTRSPKIPDGPNRREVIDGLVYQFSSEYLQPADVRVRYGIVDARIRQKINRGEELLGAELESYGSLASRSLGEKKGQLADQLAANMARSFHLSSEYAARSGSAGVRADAASDSQSKQAAEKATTLANQGAHYETVTHQLGRAVKALGGPQHPRAQQIVTLIDTIHEAEKRGFIEEARLVELENVTRAVGVIPDPKLDGKFADQHKEVIKAFSRRYKQVMNIDPARTESMKGIIESVGLAFQVHKKQAPTAPPAAIPEQIPAPKPAEQTSTASQPTASEERKLRDPKNPANLRPLSLDDTDVVVSLADHRSGKGRTISRALTGGVVAAGVVAGTLGAGAGAAHASEGTPNNDARVRFSVNNDASVGDQLPTTAGDQTGDPSTTPSPTVSTEATPTTVSDTPEQTTPDTVTLAPADKPKSHQAPATETNTAAQNTSQPATQTSGNPANGDTVASPATGTQSGTTPGTKHDANPNHQDSNAPANGDPATPNSDTTPAPSDSTTPNPTNTPNAHQDNHAGDIPAPKPSDTSPSTDPQNSDNTPTAKPDPSQPSQPGNSGDHGNADAHGNGSGDSNGNTDPHSPGNETPPGQNLDQMIKHDDGILPNTPGPVVPPVVTIEQPQPETPPAASADHSEAPPAAPTPIMNIQDTPQVESPVQPTTIASDVKVTVTADPATHQPVMTVHDKGHEAWEPGANSPESQANSTSDEMLGQQIGSLLTNQAVPASFVADQMATHIEGEGTPAVDRPAVTAQVGSYVAGLATDAATSGRDIASQRLSSVDALLLSEHPELAGAIDPATMTTLSPEDLQYVNLVSPKIQTQVLGADVPGSDQYTSDQVSKEVALLANADVLSHTIQQVHDALVQAGVIKATENDHQIENNNEGGANKANDTAGFEKAIAALIQDGKKNSSWGTWEGDPKTLAKIFEDVAAKYNDPIFTKEFLAAQAYSESHFDPNVGSPVGAGGESQFMPKTYDHWGVDANHNGTNSRFDPYDAVDAQARYMHAIYVHYVKPTYGDKYDNDTLALLTAAGYNAGPGYVPHSGKDMIDGGGNWKEPTAYAKGIQTRLNFIKSFEKHTDVQETPTRANEPPQDRIQRRDYYAAKLHIPKREVWVNTSAARLLHTFLTQKAAKDKFGIAEDGNYPKRWLDIPRDASVDSWGMYTRECVSYVAASVHQDYLAGRIPHDMPNWGGHGNAFEWPNNARRDGYIVDNHPAKGAAIIWNRNGLEHTYKGHAARVEAVLDDGSVVISEMNYIGVGKYSVEIISPQQLEQFKDQISIIHFEKGVQSR